jgi:DNA-binding NarL/FixJ family response regulator
VNSTIRIVLINDHALVRAGIRALLGKTKEVEIVGEASDRHEALQLIKELHPDIALVDSSQPGLTALELLKESSSLFPDSRIIVMTVQDTAEHAKQALASGAAGYLPRNATFDDLKEAIETVVKGGVYVSREVLRRNLSPAGMGPEDQSELLAKLTPRQLEILTLVARGHSTREIGQELNISAKTVESHRAQLSERLGIHDVASLVRFAIRMGLVKAD